MQQKKVLQLISSSGFFGADNVLIELSKQLRHSPFSPVIGVFDNQHNSHLEVAEVAKQHGFQVAVFPCRGRCDPRTIFLIRKFLRENEIKVIHSHGYKSNLYALAASLGKKVARVATCHNWLGDDPKMKLYAWLDKVFLRQFNSVVAVSEAVKDELMNCGFSDAKVRLIHNGIELDRLKIHGDSFLLKKQFNIEEDCRIIGTVGRLSEEKGLDYLLNAAAEILKKCPKVTFLMVGDGPERQKLEARAARIAETLHAGGKAAGTPFIFTGVRNDMPDIYSLMDFFVLPSLVEGLPMVLLEAMAARKPVVATRVGAVPKVIEHDRSGILVKPADEQGLAEAIISLLEDHEKAERLAEQGYRKVRDEFSAERMAEQYLMVYQELSAACSI